MRCEKAKTPERKEAENVERTPQPLSLQDIYWFWELAAHGEPTICVSFRKPKQLFFRNWGDPKHVAHCPFRKFWPCTGWETKILDRKLLKNRAQYPTISQAKDQSSRPAEEEY